MGTGSTFRDPQGRLYRDGVRLLRQVDAPFASEKLTWLKASRAQEWMRQGRLVATRVLCDQPGEAALLEHEAVFFSSYPWEWTPGQWRCAAELSLDLCEEAVEDGYVLKDATPWNVLFEGSRSVFVDHLSFDRRDPGSPLWMAYGQFARTFLLPLAAHAYLGWPLSASQIRRDGYEPSDLAPWLSFSHRWRDPLRSLVGLPLLLERMASPRWSSRPRPLPEDVSGRVLRHTLAATRRRLWAIPMPTRHTRWERYPQSATHYTESDHQAKQAFVERCLSEARPEHVLDVGANTGVYSRLAARLGARVVAWDTDVGAAERNWQQAHREGLPILPLVVDFARPTPATGWELSESQSLCERANGKFDAVLMLGIVHHLMIADQIPLPAVLGQLAAFSRRWALIEWVPREDARFVDLCRGRTELFAHLSREYFLHCLGEYFAVREQLHLTNGRDLFWVEKV